MKDLASYRPCPVCDSESAHARDAYSPPPWQVVTCTDCGMTYLRNPPTYEDPEQVVAPGGVPCWLTKMHEMLARKAAQR